MIFTSQSILTWSRGHIFTQGITQHTAWVMANNKSIWYIDCILITVENLNCHPQNLNASDESWGHERVWERCYTRSHRMV